MPPLRSQHKHMENEKKKKKRKITAQDLVQLFTASRKLYHVLPCFVQLGGRSKAQVEDLSGWETQGRKAGKNLQREIKNKKKNALSYLPREACLLSLPRCH